MDVARHVGKTKWNINAVEFIIDSNNLTRMIFTDEIKDDLRRETGAQILSTGIGDRVSGDERLDPYYWKPQPSQPTKH